MWLHNCLHGFRFSTFFFLALEPKMILQGCHGPARVFMEAACPLQLLIIDN